MAKSSLIFGNAIDKRTLRKAAIQQKKFLKRFGDDRNIEYHLVAVENEILTPMFGAKILQLSKEPLGDLPEKSIIIGNIRMGFGHYRISMAMASAAKAMGYTPLWLDLNSFPETTCTKIISYQNKLYSMASRLSQKSQLFNKFFWDPLNTEGFKKLSYNAGDQKTTELMVPIFNDLPKNVPFIATHVWASQAAVHASLTNVVNAIPDNWAMGLHLSEGALHLVQTPSSYLSYRTLKGFSGDKILNPMSEKDIVYVGHYMDDELVRNIEADCKKRIKRANNRSIRFLLTIGGAGAQSDYFLGLIETLLPYVIEGKAKIYLNIGDYQNVWNDFKSEFPELESLSQTHFDNWNETLEFAKKEIGRDEKKDDISDVEELREKKVHVFCNKDIFAAIYTTNMLMRACDVLVTKPSELAFYPVPKLMIQHVGGHECWGAIRAAEIGDGTPECPSLDYAQFMIKQFIECPDILEKMCNAIIAAKRCGIYNGAYHAVELATGIKESDYAYSGR